VPVTDTYVSPSWYPSKRVDGKVVPTWNYEVVHVAGRLTATTDAEWLHRQIRDLTDTHEAHRDEPWSVDDAPADFLAKMVNGIVGVELAVTRLEGKRKLSQNRPEADVAGVLAALAEGDERDRRVAAAMRRTAKSR
jgi:transcriptional regulator